MRVHDCIQGTEEWKRLRAGIPTASEFERILTPEGKPSKSARSYMHALLAERIMGHPTVGPVSTWMDRGNELEAEAVSFYEFQSDLQTVKVGFCINDEGTIGASPDRLVGAVGLLEIKVPAPHTHVGYLLGEGIAKAYRPQIQGQLWITGREWADSLSYHPEMPPALVRAPRDEEYIELLAKAVTEFSLALEEESMRLMQSGLIKKAA